MIRNLKECNEKITEQDLIKIQLKIKKKRAEYDSPHRGVWSKIDALEALEDAKTLSPGGNGRIVLS